MENSAPSWFLLPLFFSSLLSSLLLAPALAGMSHADVWQSGAVAQRRRPTRGTDRRTCFCFPSCPPFPPLDNPVCPQWQGPIPMMPKILLYDSTNRHENQDEKARSGFPGPPAGPKNLLLTRSRDPKHPCVSRPWGPSCWRSVAWVQRGKNSTERGSICEERDTGPALPREIVFLISSDKWFKKLYIKDLRLEKGNQEGDFSLPE